MIWSTVSSSTLEIIGFTLCWVPSLARFPGLSGCVAKGVHFERDPTSSSTFQVGKVGSGDLVERDEKQRIYSKSLKARYIYIYIYYIYILHNFRNGWTSKVKSQTSTKWLSGSYSVPGGVDQMNATPSPHPFLLKWEGILRVTKLVSFFWVDSGKLT